jgi:carbon storage regulator CsrA
MLVLTRKYQEKIRIGDNITITVLRTKGKTVRLGIEAPADVPVIRGELTFEPEAHAAKAEQLAEACVAAAATGNRPASRSSRDVSSWTTESPTRTDQVSLKRVPRDQLSGVLPQLVAGEKPLRAMMGRR